MQKIKIIVRKYTKKTGGTFVKATIGGKYVPDVLADEKQTYRVAFLKDSEASMPEEEGIYEVAYPDGDLWVDGRAEFADKLIVRVNAAKVRFDKPLPKLERDVRLAALPKEESK